jgi:hypothetical protein
MKKLLLITALAGITAVSAFGQGSVNFANNSATRIWYETGTGTTFVPIGTRFTAELVYAPDGTAAGEFESSAIRVGGTTTFGPVPGLFSGGGRTAPGITPAGGFGLFQVRVWETAAGADYREAILRGDAQYQAGTSGILRVDTGDPTTVPPGTAASLVAAGLTGFGVSPVPEPSVIGLGLLGAGALLMLRRRK